jgi:hypothetical protein
MDIQSLLEYLRRMEVLYKQRPDIKTISRLSYQHLQELSAIISVFRFGNLDIVEQLTGRLSRNTKKAILVFRTRDDPKSEYRQKELFT